MRHLTAAEDWPVLPTKWISFTLKPFNFFDRSPVIDLPSLVAAFMNARVLSGMLFGVAASDPVTFVLVALFLGATAMIASYLPARRAASIAPITALRND